MFKKFFSTIAAVFLLNPSLGSGAPLGPRVTLLGFQDLNTGMLAPTSGGAWLLQSGTPYLIRFRASAPPSPFSTTVQFTMPSTTGQPGGTANLFPYTAAGFNIANGSANIGMLPWGVHSLSLSIPGFPSAIHNFQIKIIDSRPPVFSSLFPGACGTFFWTPPGFIEIYSTVIDDNPGTPRLFYYLNGGPQTSFTSTYAGAGPPANPFPTLYQYTVNLQLPMNSPPRNNVIGIQAVDPAGNAVKTTINCTF